MGEEGVQGKEKQHEARKEQKYADERNLKLSLGLELETMLERLHHSEVGR